MKQLTIIIPAYNMEAYLPQCVESMIRTTARTALEIVIVNDGSEDRTLRIAQKYADKYPDTVRVIDKPNGNYGSTINAALPVVQGEYVKILDADDKFEGSLVTSFLTTLQKLRGVDMLVTPFVEVGKLRERKVKYNIYGRKVYENGKVYEAEQVFEDGAIRFFSMHGLCYRTELLRQMCYRQSEGISYTDQEWAFYPLFRVETIAFADIPIYRYNVTREGRTMDEAVVMQSLSQLMTVTETIAKFFLRKISSEDFSAARLEFLRNVVGDRVKIILRRYLLVMSDTAFAESDFDVVYPKLMQLVHSCQIENFTVPVNNMLKVDLLAYWQEQHQRLSPIKRKSLYLLDRVMTAVHSLIF